MEIATRPETERRAIGWDGSTLREMLERSEAIFEQTGHYQGLESLELKESDPIRYEKVYSRVRGGVVTARENAAKIAASPLVEEMGEVCFTLYTPEGDSIALSTGIIVHVHTMSEAIKYMIRHDYESNPGIADRDIFVNNDPQVSNVHCADIQTMVPVFWANELIGWAAGVTHEVDVGARTPGSSSVGPISRLEDGIDIPAMKCGTDDTLDRAYVERCRRAVRTPLYWSLDEKTRIAGCHMIRDVVTDLIETEGIEVYKRFIREVIEEGRRSFADRMREQVIPGVYRAPVFIDYQLSGEPSLPVYAARDGVLHSPMEIEVSSGGRVDISLEGANSWGFHSFNCTPVAMQGAMWAVLAETVMSNDKVNDGAYFSSGLHLPFGSWANPDTPMTSHSDSWFILVPAFAGLARALSRGYYARGYVEEVIAGWGDGNYLQGGSPDPFGEQAAISNMEVSCVGAGAGVVLDGLDYASSSWFPTGDMGDIEDWERMEPLIYLSRRVKPHTGGLGRRRGGMGFESLRMVWADAYELQNIGDGAMFCQSGIFGGYPAAAGYRHNIRNTNLPELFAERLPYPVGEDDPANSELTRLVRGDPVLDKRGVTMIEPYGRYDLYLSIMRGGPGLGDPLLRELVDVQADLDERLIFPGFASRVYGVSVSEDGDRTVVDEAASERSREAARRERAKDAIPAREWIAREREQRILPGKLIEPVARMYRSSMELSEDWACKYREFWGLDEDFNFPGDDDE